MMKLNASVLLGTLLLANTNLAEGHAVEVLSCLTTANKLRIFFRHWHADLSPVERFGTMIINNDTLIADGLIQDVSPASLVAPWADLFATGCSTPVVQDSTCASSVVLDKYDDYVWFDFDSAQCGMPVPFEVEMASGFLDFGVHLRNGCGGRGSDGTTIANSTSLYPITITQTFTDSLPPTIFANGQPCSADTGPVVVPAYTSLCDDHGSVYFGISTMDDCDGSPTVTASPPSGSDFQLGTTTVAVTAADDTGRTSTCELEVRLTHDPEQCPCDCDSSCLAEYSECDVDGVVDACCDGTACAPVDVLGRGRCIATTQCATPAPQAPIVSPTPAPILATLPTPPVAPPSESCPTQYWADSSSQSCKCNCPVGSGFMCAPAPPPITTYATISSCCSSGLSWVDPQFCDTRSRGTYSDAWFVDWQTSSCVKDCNFATDGGRCANPDHTFGDAQLYETVQECCTRLSWVNQAACVAGL